MLTEPRPGSGKMRTKIANHGGYQFSTYVSCQIGESFSSYQDIEAFPYKMNMDYFQAIKPQAFARTWIASENSGSAEFDYGIVLSFYNADEEISDKSIDGIKKYLESNLNIEEFKEVTTTIKDLHSFQFDKIRYVRRWPLKSTYYDIDCNDS